jgi:Ca2+-binding EF-hand superfamily protein
MEGFSRCEEIEDGNANAESNDEEAGLTEEEYAEFCRRWAIFDPKLRKVLDKTKLYSMLAMTKKPMGLGLSYIPPLHELEPKIEKFKIPVFEKRGNTFMYTFEDVAEAIAKHVMRILTGMDDAAMDAQLRAAEASQRDLKFNKARKGRLEKKRHRQSKRIEAKEQRKVVSRTIVSNKPSAREKMWKQRFDEVDVDGSGELDIDELGELMLLIGCNCSLEKLQKTMTDLDKDGSGTLDWDEFKQWLNTLSAGTGSDDRQTLDESDDGTLLPGSWTCAECSFNNMESRAVCVKCGVPRIEQSNGLSAPSQARKLVV